MVGPLFVLPKYAKPHINGSAVTIFSLATGKKKIVHPFGRITGLSSHVVTKSYSQLLRASGGEEIVHFTWRSTLYKDNSSCLLQVITTWFTVLDLE